MADVNEITGIVVGQYGNTITLTIVDDEGTAIDISTYTGITLKARSPDGLTTLDFSGSLVGGGTGGQFSIAPTSNNTFDREGVWDAQVQLTKAATLALTVIFTMKVEKKL